MFLCDVCARLCAGNVRECVSTCAKTYYFVKNTRRIECAKVLVGRRGMRRNELRQQGADGLVEGREVRVRGRVAEEVTEPSNDVFLVDGLVCE